MKDTNIIQDPGNERNCLLDQLGSEHSWIKQMLSILPVGIIITDPNGIIVTFNEEAARIHKYAISPSDKIEDFVGWRLLKNGRPLEPEDFPLTRVFRKGEVVKGDKQIMLLDDGTTTPISVDAAAIYDSHGRIANAVIVITDITGQERCENELLGLSREQRWR